MKHIIRDAAREDILRQYRFLLTERESPFVAERFLTAVQTTIRQISKNPGIGSPRSFVNPKLIGLRSLAVEGFPSIRVYYLVSGKTVRIIRVLHGKRDVGRVLENDAE
jgi:plasmid stabilization system protein ParE